MPRALLQKGGEFTDNLLLHIILIIVGLILIIIFIIWLRKNNTTTHEATAKNDLKIIKHSFRDGYEILEIYNLFTPKECEEIIEYAKKKGLHDSDVLSYSAASGSETNHKYRNSKTCWITDEELVCAMKMAIFSEHISDIPKKNQEMMQVAWYQPNGKFNEHFDACAYDDKDYCDKMNHYAGERRCTLLAYLNDDFEGGETEFVELGFKVKPEKGKAILFWNVDEQEKILPLSKHKANPVISGEKWICTKWSHVKPYN